MRNVGLISNKELNELLDAFNRDGIEVKRGDIVATVMNSINKKYLLSAARITEKKWHLRMDESYLDDGGIVMP